MIHSYHLLLVMLLLAGASSFTPTILQQRSNVRLVSYTSSQIKSMSEDATTTNTIPSSDTSSNPRKEGLSLALDDGTRKSHSMAQNTAFVTGFFKGLSNKDSYTKLLTSYFFVYEAMEQAFDETSEEGVRKMDDMELRRLNAVSMDMNYFYGTGWQEKIQPSRATKKYVQRIQEIATSNPKLLIAHQYTRYLGDLFGGQMMGDMATKSLNLDAGKGIEFYKFDDIDSTSDFITQWYRKLNTLDLTEKDKSEIVDEANLVFDLNIEILEELEGSALKAVSQLIWKSFKERFGLD